jgi:ubiquinone/menaquinone biosynthesis C-methylase UbiE
MTGDFTMFTAFYAAIYDRINSGSERAGLGEERRGLLTQAAGATIEIGAGTGLNLSHFPAAVTRLCLVEPDPDMRRRLRRRVGARDDVEIVDARAEALPFPDESFDTAVVTFALCSVADPDAALGEIARVLRPGGRLLFLEHVRDTDPAIARKQDHPVFLYSWIGCHPNRDILTAISRAPFEVSTVRHGEVPKAPRVERPMIVGTAARCA